MDIKKTIKKILSPIQCRRYGIKHNNGFIYIGKACKLVNASQMYFGHNVSIMPYNMIVCHKKGTIGIGDNSEIGMYSRIGCQNEVHIGNNVLTGPHVFIADYNHEYRNPDVPVMKQGNMIKPSSDYSGGGISIGDDSWIGTNVVIAGTINIGKHCVIGANSVVTHDIPDYSVAVGTPCKVIKRYDFVLNEWKEVT